MSQAIYATPNAGNRASKPVPLTFPDILCDPLIRLVMAADRVDPRSLKAELREVATGLGFTPPQSACAC